MGDDEKLETQTMPEVRQFGLWRTASILGERAVIRSLRIANGLVANVETYTKMKQTGAADSTILVCFARTLE